MIATVVTLALALAAAMTAASGADADVFGSIALLSASPLVQAEYARDPAISGNGRYIVFQGAVGGVEGIWRREITRGPDGQAVGGNLVQVAGGDAELPSISENGQYVSFTTNEGSELPGITDELPDANEAHEAPSVYVRNMEIPASSPCVAGESCAFTLASASSGPADELPRPLIYQYPQSRQVEEDNFGAAAAGRSAISADGSEVVFVTTAESDLAGPGTPAFQVAVRNLDTNQTQLVSVRYDAATGGPSFNPETGAPEPVPVQVGVGGSSFGAVYTHGGRAPLFGAGESYEPTAEIGASISADGSTVSWMGQNIGEQVSTLSGEPLNSNYSAPLWRRIGDGQDTPTRQVTGGADPSAPACLADPQTKLPEPASLADPCQGPFRTGTLFEGIWAGSVGDPIPRLSANGNEVAFLATAPLVALGSDFESGEDNRNSDLYVANMQEGLTRTEALTPLTELAGGKDSVVATNAPIADLGISPDGTQVAFTTERTIFPLGSPAYVSAPAAQPGLAELYDADLAEDTITRVTRGYREGELSAQPGGLGFGVEDPYQEKPSTDGALTPSFSDDGELLAFSSTASNLVYGDGNTPTAGGGGHLQDGSDAFVVKRETFPSAPAAQLISAPPANASPTPSWSLSATAVSLADGAVRIYVQVPGAGTLTVGAVSAVKVKSVRVARRARRAARKASRGRAITMVASRTVASAVARELEADGGLESVLLTPASAYRSLAAVGLSSTARLTFSAPGHATLHESVEITFNGSPAKHRAKRSRAASVRRGRGRAGR